jgi:Kef-type K+ transport system membrane component KefB
MDQHPATLLNDFGLSIIFAAVASHVVRLFGQPPLLGYVLAGVLLGHDVGAGWVTDEASIELISEIGLILLLFIIGLEINLRELARIGAAVFGLGIVQFAGCVLLGLGVFGALGLARAGGSFDLLYVAVALALSSTTVVVKLLHDKFEIHTAAGRLTVGILILQDLWAIVFMALQPNLLDPRLAGILRSLAFVVVLVAAAFAASRYVLGGLFRAAGKSPELVLLTAMAWCFSLAALAGAAGLSREMGALIAGVSIAAFPYGADVIAKLTGVRDFFVTLFFVSLGLKMSRPTAEVLGGAAVAVAFVLTSRLLTIVPAAYLFGRGLRTGLVTALNLSQISEFSLVVVALGVSYGHVGGDLQALVLTSMILTSVVSTYLILFNDRLARGMAAALALLGVGERAGAEGAEGAAGGADETHAERRDIVLLGCYREGEALLRRVEEEAPALRPRILVVDFNPALQADLEGRGFRWAYGDLAHPETLRSLGIEDATLVICPISDTFLKGITNRRLLGHLKKLAPRARYVVSADDTAEAARLQGDGATHVIVSPHLAGEQMYRVVATLTG